MTAPRTDKWKPRTKAPVLLALAFKNSRRLSCTRSTMRLFLGGSIDSVRHLRQSSTANVRAMTAARVWIWDESQMERGES
jgi:hypothetical protein